MPEAVPELTVVCGRLPGGTPARNSEGTPAVNGFGEMVGFIWSVADLLRGITSSPSTAR